MAGSKLCHCPNFPEAQSDLATLPRSVDLDWLVELEIEFGSNTRMFSCIFCYLLMQFELDWGHCVLNIDTWFA